MFGFGRKVEMQWVMTKAEMVIEQQREIIVDLRKQNAELMNRMMASDFKELQTYSPMADVEIDLGKEGSVIDFTDEELVGEVVAVEGKPDE